MCREKGYYSNVELLEGIIRSRFSGTATCVGNPSLRQGDRSIVEVSISISISIGVTITYSDQPTIPHAGVSPVSRLLQAVSRRDDSSGSRVLSAV